MNTSKSKEKKKLINQKSLSDVKSLVFKSISTSSLTLAKYYLDENLRIYLSGNSSGSPRPTIDQLNDLYAHLDYLAHLRLIYVNTNLARLPKSAIKYHSSDSDPQICISFTDTENSSIKCSRSILANSSAYLSTLLQKTATRNSLLIDANLISAKQFCILYDYLATNRLAFDSGCMLSQAFDLYSIASFLEIECLKIKLEKVVLAQIDGENMGLKAFVTNLLQILAWSSINLNSTSWLYRQTMMRLEHNFSALCKSSKARGELLNNLNYACVLHLLRSPYTQITCESHMLKFMCEWFRLNQSQTGTTNMERIFTLRSNLVTRFLKPVKNKTAASTLIVPLVNEEITSSCLEELARYIRVNSLLIEKSFGEIEAILKSYLSVDNVDLVMAVFRGKCETGVDERVRFNESLMVELRNYLTSINHFEVNSLKFLPDLVNLEHLDGMRRENESDVNSVNQMYKRFAALRKDAAPVMMHRKATRVEIEQLLKLRVFREFGYDLHIHDKTQEPLYEHLCLQMEPNFD